MFFKQKKKKYGFAQKGTRMAKPEMDYISYIAP